MTRPADELIRTTAAIGNRPAISIHVCGENVERLAPSTARELGDRRIRRALVTPRVVEVARAGGPWTRPEPPGASTAIGGCAE